MFSTYNNNSNSGDSNITITTITISIIYNPISLSANLSAIF